MSTRSSVPSRGSLVWLDFVPQAGREQSGRRPALILSPASYNQKTGLAIACPITSQAKGYPFEVPLPAGLPVSGVVLADHVKSIDWRARRAELIGDVGEAALGDVVGKLLTLIETER